MNRTKPDIELLSTAQAAQAIGLADQTLRVWRLKGIGPRFVKLGNRCRYDTRDLAAWIESHKRSSTADRGNE